MEGQERRHLEARIRVLRDIQTLLDAAVLQMNQYGVLVARLEQEARTGNDSNAPQSPEVLPPTNSQPAESEATNDASHSATVPTSSVPSNPDPEPEVLTPEEETNLSDQERLRRRRLQRFMNGAEQN